MDEETIAGSDSDPKAVDARGYSPQAIHLLRTVQNNTLKLSQMADQKASILMGATFLVFSLLVSRSLLNEPNFAMLVLAASAFLSSLCAVMAVLPSVGRLPSDSGKINKLFFGHFALLEEQGWQSDVLEELRTDERVFRAMLHDIYQDGLVLQRRKYRFLSIAYRIFIVGLFATMATYAIESIVGA